MPFLGGTVASKVQVKGLQSDSAPCPGAAKHPLLQAMPPRQMHTGCLGRQRIPGTVVAARPGARPGRCGIWWCLWLWKEHMGARAC